MNKEKAKSESFEFQSEVQQLLNILVYSLYQNKEVFVRELVSNAVDALNKAQFELLTHPGMPDQEKELEIHISFNKSRKSIIIEDNGIGMTREELIGNLGTIAHSGTAEFLSRLAEAESSNKVDLIGKFGVGFYSAFMVAREIFVTTRSLKQDEPAWLWKSTGDTAYTIEETVKKERGTRIELLLKKEEEAFLDPTRIRQVLQRHSQFVPFSIFLEKEKFESAAAIWTQPKSSLKVEQYNEFYHFFDNTDQDPLGHLHVSSDGPVQFNALLFIPGFTLESLGLETTEPGVDLFSRKVLIQKSCRDILPEYFRFVRGIVDSEDIPLNISRESIQHNARIDRIRKHLVKKLISHLKGIQAKDREKYQTIWDRFGRHLREGVAMDPEHKDALSPLLWFRSTRTGETEWVDLKTYTERMGEKQKEIYFITGTDLKSLGKNPALEAFRRKEIEVLLLTDPLDEVILDRLGEFEGKAFKLAESADIHLDESETEAEDPETKDLTQKFAAYLKTIFGKRVEDVRVSSRLVEHPCLLVRSGDGPSAQMEKVMRMMNEKFEFSRRILEINPGHALIREMVRMHTSEPDSPTLKDLSLLLLDNQMMREGLIDGMDEVIPRIQSIMLEAARKK